ncbi:MAG: hypothetical protein CUN55_01895 [Phototrophicales bacterium]|nr:MAG: hypothetical protein CUN55_01895 [Phototrophicales bacterium]
MKTRAKAIIKLTRWQEFLAFTTILTLLGGLTAHQVNNTPLDWKLIVVWVANLAAMAYAFMVNDIEDAPDDARDPNRISTNPVANLELSVPMAWLATISFGVLSAICYAVVGPRTFVVGIITLILAHLYSWKPVRLKAKPLIDIISHALMLSTLLYVAAFFAYEHDLSDLWMIVIVTFAASANGQLYNQVRDYEADRVAGLHNTASILGKTLTDRLATATIVTTGICLGIAILQGIFPLWLGGVLIAVTPIVFYLLRNSTHDMRGSETDDPMALFQRKALYIMNLTLLAWLIAVYV